MIKAFVSRALYSSLGLVGANCADPNIDAVWGMGERRVFLGEASNSPPSSSGVYRTIVPVGVGRWHFALFASEGLSVGDRVVVTSSRLAPSVARSVGSGGTLHVGRGAKVGHIYGLDPDTPAQLEEQATVDGYIKTAGRLDLAGSVRVRDGVWQNAKIQAEAFDWRPNALENEISSGVNASTGGDAALSPGNYATLLAHPGTEVKIHSGHYAFESLRIEGGATLSIDNSFGPVYIWVVRELVLAGAIRELFLGSNVFIGYLGKESPQISGAVRATLVAPEARIVLPATSEPHVGAVFARAITVSQGARLEHRPFVRQARSEHPAGVCRECLRDLLNANCCTTGESHANLSGHYLACLRSCSTGVPDADLSCTSTCMGNTETDWPSAECTPDALKRFAECQLKRGYRTTVCIELGLVRPKQLSCE